MITLVRLISPPYGITELRAGSIQGGETEMDIEKYKVAVDRLCWSCDPSFFDFACTKDLTPLEEFIGQDRAILGVSC